MNVVRAALIILTFLSINEKVSSGSFTSPMPVIDNCGVCAEIYDPVCANNGEIYYNECMFNCEKDMAQDRDNYVAEIYIVDCPW